MLFIKHARIAIVIIIVDSGSDDVIRCLLVFILLSSEYAHKNAKCTRSKSKRAPRVAPAHQTSAATHRSIDLHTHTHTLSTVKSVLLTRTACGFELRVFVCNACQLIDYVHFHRVIEIEKHHHIHTTKTIIESKDEKNTSADKHTHTRR